MTSQNYISTKEEVYEYVRKITYAFNETNKNEFTTGNICQKLNVSRNLASQYLNELAKEGLLIKINSRPVYFFDKHEMEKKYQAHLRQNEFNSLDEMMQILKRESSVKHGFSRVIGCNSRLSYNIEQLKSALNYPPHGLPALLYGATGTGKSYLTCAAVEYAYEKAIVSPESKFIVFHCAEFSEKPEECLQLLFGTYNPETHSCTKGYLAQAEEGILRLDDVECLQPEALDKLYYFMDRGIFLPCGAEKYVKVRVRLLFTTKKDPTLFLPQPLLRRIPIKLKMPLLSERTLEERRQFLIDFFLTESKRTEYTFFITPKTFNALLNYHYPENISQMENFVKQVCANAILSSDRDTSEKEIHFYHLPVEIINDTKLQSTYEKESEQLINLSDYDQDSDVKPILGYYKKILHEYQSSKDSIKLFIEKGQAISNMYYDYLSFWKNHYGTETQNIEKIIGLIFQQLQATDNLSLPNSCGVILARELYIKGQLGEYLSIWENKHLKEYSEILELCKSEFPNEYMLCQILEQKIHEVLELKIGIVEQIFFILYIQQYTLQASSNATRAIIICHGYATASSIADTINRIFGQNIFHAFDIPFNSTLFDIKEQLLKYVNQMIGCQNLIILADLGSTENTDILLEQVSDINIAIINNVSTKLALSIGEKIVQHTELKSMLEAACQESFSTYRMIQRKEREKALLFVSENGVVIAQRFAELFSNSLPKKKSLSLLTYDYTYFLDKEREAELLSQYNILFATGTIDPGFQHITYISMEDIMLMNRENFIHTKFSSFLSNEEIEQFDRNLLQNFSLSNVVSSLTILNPSKVLEMVGDVLDLLQKNLGQKWKAKTIIGLNIHVSCLLERLITRQPLETYKDIEKFEQTHASFIKIVQESFTKICSYYGVEIPVAEVAYIYDFISNDPT